MKKQVAVIGGGASGLTAAIWAARSGASVIILEHTDRVGKKILSTGNGRCNLTNAKIQASCYRSGDPQFPMEAIRQFGWKDTLRWFSSMGLLCHCRMESYYYPLSDQASAVLDCLRMECSRLGVVIRTGVQPDEIRPVRESRGLAYQILTDRGEVRADAVILACGSKAAPNTGSDGSGYALARSLGHRIIKPLPALVQLRCQGNHYRQLAGIRTDAGLRLLVGDQELWQERGELQITDYGISGIPVFQLSRFAARGLDEGRKVRVMIDFLPFMDRKESRIFLERRFADFGDRSGEDFFTGVLHKKLAAVLLKMSGIRPDQPASSASLRQREHLLRAIKEYEAQVSSVNPFANAQVCCGGVDVRQVDPATMESKLREELYFAGEILDVDGICGGYNLQWAWSSGKAAGCRAAQKRRRE